MVSTLTSYVPGKSPAISDGLGAYFRQIQRYPILSHDEEYALAERYYEKGDLLAAHTLVKSYLRYVAKIALGYRGYGLPTWDLISEGNIGLMKAVKKFNPARGVRLATYALWWIKASIQEYILRSWSLVKIGTTATQKKLFFNLRKLRKRIQLQSDKPLDDQQIVDSIASELRVGVDEVTEMSVRLLSDASLNTSVQSLDGESREWQDDFVDAQAVNSESYLVEKDESSFRVNLMKQVMEKTLTDRERDIIRKRHLTKQIITLEALSEQHGISKERVRQIAVRAMKKLEQECRKMESRAGHSQ